MLLKAGQFALDGKPDKVLESYFETTETAKQLLWNGPPIGDSFVQVIRARASQTGGTVLRSDKPIILYLEIQVKKAVTGLIVGWEVWNSQDQLLAYSLWDDSKAPPGVTTMPGVYKIQLEIPGDIFGSGVFLVGLDLGIHNQRRIVPPKLISFWLEIENTLGIGRRYPTLRNAFRPAWHWKILK
jgi:hypothetical protein